MGGIVAEMVVPRVAGALEGFEWWVFADVEDAGPCSGRPT